MNKIFTAALAAAAVTIGANVAQAQDDNVAGHDVSFQVDAINALSVSGNPSLLLISAATAGTVPDSATASGTYAITTNQTGRKITASINSNMPTGLTLKVLFEAPAGSGVAARKTLSSGSEDVVTGIGPLSESGLAIGYSLHATALAAVAAEASRTVTYTIVLDA